MKDKEGFLEELRKIFVTFDIFNLTNQSTEKRLSQLEKIFYAVISAIGLAVIGAWMSFILRKP